MDQEQLARQMHGVVYTQRKLSYLQEKLTEASAHNPVPLVPGQRTLSVANVVAASEHERRMNEIIEEINQEETTVKQLTESLLEVIPEIIKNLIRQGMPLVADWQKDGIASLALVYEKQRFIIIPDNELD
ncbi:hypothetical protein A0257_07570 [Hymenobacter psoromatis]|nr:hypothetical protein A0257_07570 [Hymenobacter psoromatis]